MIGVGRAAGKIILLGEHAVVFGEPALAAGLPVGLVAHARLLPGGGLRVTGGPGDPRVAEALGLIARRLDVTDAELTFAAEIPAGGGLGSSAAFAVATARALTAATGRALTEAQLDAVALESERVFHGNPSGVDAAVCARRGVWLFRRGPPPWLDRVAVSRPMDVVVASTGVTRATRGSVESLAAKIDRQPGTFTPIVKRLGALALAGAADVSSGDIAALGAKFDEAHALLATCGLSCPELDAIVAAARGAGAFGAKLTGAGNGGAAIAIGPDPQRVLDAVRARGFDARVARIGQE